MSPIGTLVTQVNYFNRQRVKDDAKRVTETYKSLLPKIAVYGKRYWLSSTIYYNSVFVVNNMGVESRLLALAGTIPIKFGGAQVSFNPVFNIVKCLFLNYCVGITRSTTFRSNCSFQNVIPTKRQSFLYDQHQVSFIGHIFLM